MKNWRRKLEIGHNIALAVGSIYLIYHCSTHSFNPPSCVDIPEKRGFVEYNEQAINSSFEDLINKFEEYKNSIQKKSYTINPLVLSRHEECPDSDVYDYSHRLAPYLKEYNYPYSVLQRISNLNE